MIAALFGPAENPTLQGAATQRALPGDAATASGWAATA